MTSLHPVIRIYGRCIRHHILTENLTKNEHWIRDLNEILALNQKTTRTGNGWEGLTSFKAEIAAKYGAPVYSRHPPTTAIFPV